MEENKYSLLPHGLCWLSIAVVVEQLCTVKERGAGPTQGRRKIVGPHAMVRDATASLESIVTVE